jgi:cytohesin
MNRVDRLEELLSSDGSLTTDRLPNLDTPLHLAARVGASEAANFLISSDADVNAANDRFRTPLHLAAESGHLGVASSLIAAGAQINFETEGKGTPNETPLHLATSQGHPEIVSLLLEHGADVHKHAKVIIIPGPYGAIKIGGQTALHDASEHDCVNCAALLLDHGADIHATDVRKATPFMWAVDRGGHETAALLLDAGVDVNHSIDAGIPIHLAAYSGDSAMVQLLLERGADVNAARKDGATALSRVVNYPDGGEPLGPMTADRLGAVRALLIGGADTNIQGFLGDAPLHRAASKGYAPAAELLLAYGADVNGRNASESTPLHSATQQGRMAVVELLLANGADVNARSKSNTPLSLAVRFGHNDIVALLLEHGADVHTIDHRDMTLLDEVIFSPQHWTPEQEELAVMLLDAGIDLRHGEGGRGTPLHRATRRGSKEIAALLIQRGADVDARDESRRTPLHDAVDQKHLEIVKLLIESGAEINPRDLSNQTPMYGAWGTGVSARIKELLRQHGGTGAFGEPH